MHPLVSLARAAVLALGASVVALSASAGVVGSPGNPDTGIRRSQCFTTGSDALVNCDATALPGQDGQRGRDAGRATNDGADGLLGFSFVKVCNSGQAAGSGTCPADPALGPGPDDWACVTDRVTGIMWEVKTDSGLRSRTATYTNYSRDYDPVGEYGSPTDAAGYVTLVNQSRLCGFSDWGYAHTPKVQSILDYGRVATGRARVDGTFFPGVQADWYWDNSPNPSSPGTAFAISFGSGAVTNGFARSERHFVQVLRNGKTVFDPQGRYRPSPDGTEVHDTTGNALLIWRRCVEGMAWDAASATCTGTSATFTHEEALRWAARQAKATGQPWRVPSVKELDWLIHRSYPSPPIDPLAFPATPASPHWTATPEPRTAGQAWAVDFLVGELAPHARPERLVLRLARDEDGS